jgi:cytochrome c oxidase cbb3-type subunit IV
MYKDILRHIAGIEVFPVLSLVVFVTVFAAVLVYVARLDAARLSRLSSLPLDTDGGAALPIPTSVPAGDPRVPTP